MLYTIDNVAKILNVHPRTVRRYIERGELKAERIGGSFRITEHALKELFDTPELQDSINKHFEDKSHDMVSLYLQGKHRLQEKYTVSMLTFVFSPTKKPSVLAKTNEWIARLNRLGENSKFEFLMNTNEQDLCRIVIIGEFSIIKSMAEKFEQILDKN